MKIPYYDCMTNDMKEVVDFTLDEENLKKEFLFCHEMYLKAKNAGSIRLPHVAENGEKVSHGARLFVNKLESYWEIRRDAVKEFLPRDWVEKQDVSSITYRR